MSEQNSTFIFKNSCLVKEEVDICPDNNSIPLVFIKDEIPTYRNNDDNNELNHIEDNFKNKSNNITLEGFDVDRANVLKIKTEKYDRNTGIQNSVTIIEDSFLINKEIDIKEEILTYLNNEEGNETSYNIENIPANDNKFNTISIDTLNSCVVIKEENVCKDTNIHNSISVIEDEFSVKVEDDSFYNANSSLLCSINKENTIFQKNDDNNEEFFIKIEQMSPKCDIFTDNNFEIKPEIDSKTNNCETSMNDLKSDYNESITNCHQKQYKSDTRENPIKCNICHKSFTDKRTLKRHMYTHTAEKLYKCNICSESFPEKNNLKIHMITHTGEKPFKCNICSKSFAANKYLKNHMFTHTEEKPNKCNICNKSFIDKRSLNGHMFTHTGDKPYKCNICSKSFIINRNLKRHMITHTGEKPYTCNICHKSFTKQNTLKNHMITHTEEKPFKCNNCHKSFAANRYLKNHMLTHTEEKSHKCNICNKSFKEKRSLNDHMFTHTGDKPYKCDICHKSFTKKNTLKNHMITHTGENPFKCNICHKSFTATSLKRHMFTTHTGEKPFNCDICQKSFARKDKLNNHILIHTAKNHIDVKSVKNHLQ